MQTYFDILPDDIYVLIIKLISKHDYLNFVSILNTKLISREDKQKKFQKHIKNSTEDYHIDVYGRKQGRYFKKIGDITYTGTYIDDKKEGTYLKYHIDDLISVCEYSRGKKHGRSAKYRNGDVIWTAPYRRGKRHGDVTKYNRGDISRVTPYKDDLKYGTSYTYHRRRYPSDTLRVAFSCDYVADKKHGMECEYDDFGMLVSQYFRKHGVLHGECFYLDRDGCVMINYDNGKKIEYKKYVNGILKYRNTYSHCNDEHINTTTYNYNSHGVLIGKHVDIGDSDSNSNKIYVCLMIFIFFILMLTSLDTYYLVYVLFSIIFFICVTLWL